LSLKAAVVGAGPGVVAAEGLEAAALECAAAEGAAEE
jgi:hypothetical protein